MLNANLLKLIVVKSLEAELNILVANTRQYGSVRIKSDLLATSRGPRDDRSLNILEDHDMLHTFGQCFLQALLKLHWVEHRDSTGARSWLLFLLLRGGSALGPLLTCGILCEGFIIIHFLFEI